MMAAVGLASRLIRAPAGTALMLPGRPKINNWAFETVPQAGFNGRRGYQPRGKALGGSSAINVMAYTRGHRSDYDDWAALGCRGWSYADVLPYFRRAEANQNGADAWHGDSGPLHVANQRSPHPITGAFIRAAGELQIQENADFNGSEQEGVGHSGPLRLQSDKRSDCVQVVIALVATPEGLPLAYERHRRQHDERDFLAKIEAQYGKARRIFDQRNGSFPRRPRNASNGRKVGLYVPDFSTA